ncbi:hypothetical protein D4768_09780 [Rhodococcus erythropolis]|uniref:hypothetical protein n=1 Tax=Rhodococcus erythropolis TaxID=1833 RepID=UPI001F206AD9|nr:hypothetical protein [Rhodococcus erythropolis]UJC77957.1 hypothetical protein D4768_09780 [Rhodococcus erythropolis]
MIVHKSTTGLYRSYWGVYFQRRAVTFSDVMSGRRNVAIFGPERFIADGKLEIGKLRGGGRTS